MFRKYLFFCLILLLSGSARLNAQDLRTVRGLVSDENGQYIGGATLKADGVDTPFKTNRVGQFEIKIPFSSKTLTVYVDGYAPMTMDATASFVLFQMKPQSQGDAARDAALQESLAAAAAAKASKEAQAEAERQAREQAEKQAREQAEKQAREKAEKQAREKQTKEKEPSRKPAQKARGSLANQFDFSYAYQFSSARIIYENSGGRNYSALHPLQLTYAIGWRFNDNFTLTAGAGFLYNLVSLERKGDIPDPSLYSDCKLQRYDVPVFLNFRCHFTQASIQPYLTLSGGIYALSFIGALERKLPVTQMPLLMDLGVGVSFHLTGNLALNLAFSARNTPWPQFSETGFNGYPIRIVPAVTAGISF